MWLGDAWGVVRLDKKKEEKKEEGLDTNVCCVDIGRNVHVLVAFVLCVVHFGGLNQLGKVVVDVQIQLLLSLHHAILRGELFES